jgi:hypothetical protein
VERARPVVALQRAAHGAWDAAPAAGDDGAEALDGGGGLDGIILDLTLV